SHCERPEPPVEGGRPRSGHGTLLRPAQFPGTPTPLAAHDLIGINSDLLGRLKSEHARVAGVCQPGAAVSPALPRPTGIIHSVSLVQTHRSDRQGHKDRWCCKRGDGDAYGLDLSGVLSISLHVCTTAHACMPATFFPSPNGNFSLAHPV